MVNYYGEYQISEKQEIVSRETKAGLRDTLKMDGEVIHLMDAQPVSPDDALSLLIRNTSSSMMRSNLRDIQRAIPSACIRSGYVHRDDWDIYDNRWTDDKHTVLSLCKAVELFFDSATSQVLSKIYSGKKSKLFLSTRPIDLLSISDSSTWTSCHCTIGGTYRQGNIDYMLDGVTAVVYATANNSSDTVEHINDAYDGDSDTCISVDMQVRVLVHVTDSVIAIGKAYGKHAINRSAIANAIATRMGGTWTNRNCSVVADSKYRGYQDEDFFVIVKDGTSCPSLIFGGPVSADKIYMDDRFYPWGAIDLLPCNVLDFNTEFLPLIYPYRVDDAWLIGIDKRDGDFIAYNPDTREYSYTSGSRCINGHDVMRGNRYSYVPVVDPRYIYNIGVDYNVVVDDV